MPVRLKDNNNHNLNRSLHNIDILCRITILARQLFTLHGAYFWTRCIILEGNQLFQHF